jgi:hypothetical protein
MVSARQAGASSYPTSSAFIPPSSDSGVASSVNSLHKEIFAKSQAELAKRI